ncbi:LLM class flavin-dependent oxidoreductase [Paenarthrobacter sp. NPDC089675]|uniref:LLM class flavin-dependent oxidoreductase n=1 Tax=Paenarthrobacter sp. NPDC089675 TaxID=3364376 RepID=UPI00381AFD44
MGKFALGIELDGDGAHPAAWRYANHPPGELLTPKRYAAVAAKAEAAGFTFATFQDAGPGETPNVTGRLDTVEVAAFVAAATDRLGLVPAVNTIHAEPFHLANQLSSLDWASRGRSGWLAEVRETPAIAASYGARSVADPDAVQREGAEVVAATRRLWDTWEDGVFIADAANNRFLDLDKFHYADFRGEFFSIKGPSITPRPPQGQPVVFGRPGGLSAELPDAVVISAATVTGVAAAAEEQRRRGVLRVVADLDIVLDAGDSPAQERLQALDSASPWTASPDVLRFVGNAAGLRALLTELSGVVDAVRLLPAVLDTDLEVLASAVIPGLIAEGVFIPPTSGSTLRESLGLPKPVNSIATSKEPA